MIDRENSGTILWLLIAAIMLYGVARLAIGYYFDRKRRFHVELMNLTEEDDRHGS